MGKGSDSGVNEVSSQRDIDLPVYTWEDIKNGKNWVVLNGTIYDVSNFMKKHPGGPRILQNHLGEDVSVRFYFIINTIYAKITIFPYL